MKNIKSYKLADYGVVDTETGAFIPKAEGNRHWQEYQGWLAEGNTPDPDPISKAIDFEYWLDNAVRPQRDAKMAAFEWRISRYNRQVQMSQTPTDDISVLNHYMHALANLPPTLTAIVDPIPWPVELAQ